MSHPIVEAFIDGRSAGKSPYRPHGLMLGTAVIVEGEVVVTERRYDSDEVGSEPGGTPFWCPKHGEVRVTPFSVRDDILVAIRAT